MVDLVVVKKETYAVLVVPNKDDKEQIKKIADFLDTAILATNTSAVEVKQFDPAAWDFKEVPINGNKTIGEYWEEKQAELLKNAQIGSIKERLSDAKERYARYPDREDKALIDELKAQLAEFE